MVIRRQPGSALTIAPAPPFTDTRGVLELAEEYGRVRRPAPHELTVQCGQVAGLAARLKAIGCAGLRATVRIPAPVSPAVVRDLAHAGVAELEIEEVVGAAVALDWLEMAKVAAELAMELRWRSALPAEIVRSARHLPPPIGDERWRREWRFGLLGWRRGPGFARVVDRRSGHRETVVDLPTIERLFGQRLDISTPRSMSTVGQLVDAGLVVVIGERAAWLPSRLRRWPVTEAW